MCNPWILWFMCGGALVAPSPVNSHIFLGKLYMKRRGSNRRICGSSQRDIFYMYCINWVPQYDIILGCFWLENKYCLHHNYFDFHCFCRWCRHRSCHVSGVCKAGMEGRYIVAAIHNWWFLDFLTTWNPPLAASWDISTVLQHVTHFALHALSFADSVQGDNIAIVLRVVFVPAPVPELFWRTLRAHSCGNSTCPIKQIQLHFQFSCHYLLCCFMDILCQVVVRKPSKERHELHINFASSHLESA